MFPTNRRPSLAREALVIDEELGVDLDARALCVELSTPYMDAINGRSRTPLGGFIYRLRKAEDRACPFRGVARFMFWLAAVGAPESVVMRIELYIASIRRRLFVGVALRSLAELDLAEEEAEHEENRITLRLAHEPPTLELYCAAAAVNEREAAIEVERAALYRRLARESLQPFMRPMGVPVA